jgi:hypothetical protein
VSVNRGEKTTNLSTIVFFFSAGGYVGEHEAGQRLFQVCHDPRCAKSGVYWGWNGGPREGRGAEAIEKGGQISGGGGAGGGWDSLFENDQSAKVLDVETAVKLFQYSTDITGAEWPNIKAVTSPCPTLKVIGAITKGQVAKEELKRMREMGRPGIEEKVEKPSKRKRVAMAADRVVTGVTSNTVGRVARFAGKRILGEFPEEATGGSFHELNEAAPEAAHFPEQDAEELMEEVAQQLNKGAVVDIEDEALFQQIYEDETATRISKERKTKEQPVSA